MTVSAVYISATASAPRVITPTTHTACTFLRGCGHGELLAAAIEDGSPGRTRQPGVPLARARWIDWTVVDADAPIRADDE